MDGGGRIWNRLEVDKIINDKSVVKAQFVMFVVLVESEEKLEREKRGFIYWGRDMTSAPGEGFRLF